MGLAAKNNSGALIKDVQKLTQAFAKAFMPLQTLSKDLVGAALYSSFDKKSDSVYALGAIYTQNATPSQQAFTQNHVVGKKIYKAGTSVGETLESNDDIGFYASGYRADHMCLNFRAYDGVSQPNIVQLVFQRPDFFAGQDPEKRYKPVKDQVADTFLKAGLTPGLKAVNHKIAQYGGANTDPFALSQRREMFLVFSDVSGFVKIRQALGADKAVDFATNMRRQFSKIARQHGGDLYRAEGDGIWLAFPVMGFDQKMQGAFMRTRVMPAIYDLAGTYQNIKNNYGDKAIQQSHLKAALTYSALKATAGHSRYQAGNLEGDGFYVARDLSDNAPRQHDVVLFGNDVIRFLPKKQQDKLFNVSVPPDRIGQGKGMILKP